MLHLGVKALPHVFALSLQMIEYFQGRPKQCLSQDLETGCLKLAVVKFLGAQIFTHISTINMYKFIKIRHDIIKLCHGKYKEMKKFNYKLEIEIFRNSTQKTLGVLRGSLRSEARGLLDEPRTRLKFGDWAFSIRLWNALPQQLKDSTMCQAFKKCLKTHLFRLAH